MPKERRRISDLVHEETHKPRDTNENKKDVTTPATLGEVGVDNTGNIDLKLEELTELQTSEYTNLQTSEVNPPVMLVDIAVGDKGNVESEEITELQTSESTNLQSFKLPKYLKLERKEARLRQDQIDALTDLTRKLNRMKRGKSGERLTDNTLIRVAIDLLLSKAEELQGATEEELRRSLNLVVPE